MSDMTLEQAKAWLRDRIDEGERCPCCTQFAKVYKRKIHSTMARDLVSLWRRFGRDEWFHLADHVGHPGDFAKLRYWGMVVEEVERRPDGGRSGWWLISLIGERFVRGSIGVEKYAHIYDGRCLQMSGGLVWVRDALGDRFDYEELMAA